jgi:putative ABC transport system permease protein
LALAIGANTAIFSVVDAVLINPLPYADADRLVSIRVSAPDTELRGEYGVSPEFFVAYRDSADMLEDLGMFQTMQSTARTEDRVDRLFMAAVTTSIFPTLGARPVLGRLPNSDDDAERASVMVISHWLWREWFGADPSVIGRMFEAAGARRTVIGVMGPEFRFPNSRTALWIRAAIADETRIKPGNFSFNLIARKRPRIDSSDLAAQLAIVAKQLPDRFGG